MEFLDSVAVTVQNRADEYNEKIEDERQAFKEERRARWEFEWEMEKERKRRQSSTHQQDRSSDDSINRITDEDTVETPTSVIEPAVETHNFDNGCETWCIPCNQSNGFPGINHDKSSSACSF